MCRSTSSVVRAPTISSRSCARGLQVGEHEFFRRLARASRPAAPRQDLARACSSSATCRVFEMAAVSRSDSRPSQLRTIARRKLIHTRACLRRYRRCGPSRPLKLSRDDCQTGSLEPGSKIRSCSITTIPRRFACRQATRSSSGVDRFTAIEDHHAGDRRRRARALPARTPSRSTTSPVSRHPAVSTSVTARPSRSTRSDTRSRVVPAISVTIARSAPTSALKRLDLPTFGRADHDNCRALANQPAARARRRAVDPVDRPRNRSRRAVSSALDEVIALVRKIERRLEPRDQIEELRVDLRDAACQRAFELIEGDARLQRRRRRNQIGHGLGLNRSRLPLRNARSVNSPGRGQPRARGDGARRRSHAARRDCRAR